MKKLLLLAIVAALAAAPVSASGIGLHASYWDAGDVEEALGGGLSFALPLGDSGFDLDFRGTYFEEADLDQIGDDETDLDDELREIFDEGALQLIPVDVGLRYNFAPRGAFNPYVGGGASYVFLDVDGGEVDDETGWYALLGSRFGRPGGASFFVEAIYRGIEATVQNDPDDIDDIDDIDLRDEVDIDLDGIGVNLGVVFTFR